jgi:hypothetical protein
MWGETGFPRADVENEFLQMRRRQFRSALMRRARRRPRDADTLLLLDDVVDALGSRGEQPLGLQTIGVDSIVGSLEARRDFDRRFRPTSNRVRSRWEQLALAERRGAQLPPIEVRRVGPLHFVADGHHRVSIARASNQTLIDAYVTEVLTELPADGLTRQSDLALKRCDRQFRRRVPLPSPAYEQIRFDDLCSYAKLGDGFEAWAFRRLQAEGHFLNRSELARRWYAEEYLPHLDSRHSALDALGDSACTTTTRRDASRVQQLDLAGRPHRQISLSFDAPASRWRGPVTIRRG